MPVAPRQFSATAHCVLAMNFLFMQQQYLQLEAQLENKVDQEVMVAGQPGADRIADEKLAAAATVRTRREQEEAAKRDAERDRRKRQEEEDAERARRKQEEEDAEREAEAAAASGSRRYRYSDRYSDRYRYSDSDSDSDTEPPAGPSRCRVAASCPRIASRCCAALSATLMRRTFRRAFRSRCRVAWLCRAVSPRFPDLGSLEASEVGCVARRRGD